MPPIDVAMMRSLRGGAWGIVRSTVVDSIAAEVMRRDAVASAGDTAEDIKHTFTNWNLCMTKDYCKWPAFGIIALLSLIIIGVTICIIRCCCLGLSCCCGCFRCLKCCGECCGCCDPPGNRPHKYSEEPFGNAQAKHGGYRQQAPMEAHFPPPPSTAHSAQGFPTGPPQYAEFDVKKSSPDALPAMPSWEEANAKKVPIDEVEMDDLPKKEKPIMQRMPPQRGPMPGNNPHTMAEMPAHPYNLRNNMPTHVMNMHAQQQQQQPVNGYGGPRGQPHGHPPHASGPFELDQPFDARAPPVAMGMGPLRHSPSPIQNAYGPRQLVQRQAPLHTSMQATVHELDGHERLQADMDLHSRSANPRGPPNDGMSPRLNSPLHLRNEHGMAQERYASPGPGPDARKSPAPQGGGEYGSVPPRFDSPFSNAPSRANSPRTLAYKTYSPATPNGAQITNSAGFDFNSGYSRPQNQEEPETPEAYPGYKPYTPSTPTSPTHKPWHGEGH